ncbi:MAG TPA: hypothetical protein VGH40_01470 [Roseiarcus sp.]|jgi:hypothetical protein
MSNPIRLEADEIAYRMDPAAARRQFSLSLVVGLAVLALAGFNALRPAQTAAGLSESRHGGVRGPEFVAPRSAYAAAASPARAYFLTANIRG